MFRSHLNQLGKEKPKKSEKAGIDKLFICQNNVILLKTKNNIQENYIIRIRYHFAPKLD